MSHTLTLFCTHRTCQVKCDRFCLKLKCVFWCLPNTTSILFFSSSHVAKDWYFVSKVSVINSKRPIGGVYSVLRGGTLVWSSTKSLVNFVWPFPKSFEHLGAAEESLRPKLLRTLGGYKSLDLESYNWVLQMPRGFLHRSVLQIGIHALRANIVLPTAEQRNARLTRRSTFCRFYIHDLKRSDVED